MHGMGGVDLLRRVCPLGFILAGPEGPGENAQRGGRPFWKGPPSCAVIVHKTAVEPYLPLKGLWWKATHHGEMLRWFEPQHLTALCD